MNVSSQKWVSEELQILWLANISFVVSHEGAHSSWTGRWRLDFQAVLFQKFSGLDHPGFLVFTHFWPATLPALNISYLPNVVV